MSPGEAFEVLVRKLLLALILVLVMVVRKRWVLGHQGRYPGLHPGPLRSYAVPAYRFF